MAERACFEPTEKRKVDSPISIAALDGRLLARGDFSVTADRGSAVRDVHLFLVQHHAFPTIAPQHNRAASHPSYVRHRLRFLRPSTCA